ncbi:Peptidyl-prolyl cis-trans isomerase FKBP62 [Hondaea fermentalgiana]|uniref:Protein unc-45 homolog B n=1 Tax=Hondaea fermentalgiana TaxID=2315210 RepID=A0A2R5GM75_9STRA|nr:Peptidyl-prolyl cis-trans isomerase FKBP62 [Hondaea fermentalgiana]|eukprot:GBG28974.1 Peptidyl-prolyl cis-trans isomerase FKBP62 [Hondaea fermentalgiana]
MAAHKARGNELFAAGKFEEACEAYAEALKHDGSEDLGPEEAKSLRVTVLCNRAACLLKLERFKDCEKDCSDALESDASNVKALYRRAQARAALENLEGAVLDLRRLLEADSNNKPAQALMLKLRQMAENKGSAVSQAMEALQTAASTNDDGARTATLRKLLASIMDDSQLAASMATRDACTTLWAMRTKDALALKILSKMAEIDACWEFVLKAVDIDEATRFIETPAETPGDSGAAACLNMLWRFVKRQEGKDATPTLKLVVSSLRADDEALRRVAVEATVRLCADDKDASKAFFTHGGLEALMSMIERDHNRDEPLQQVSVVLGQVLPALEDDKLIKEYAVAFCKPLLLASGVHEQIRGAAALDAIYYANKDLGLALVQEEDLLQPLARIARTGSSRAQALAADVFSHMANSEAGRGLLAGDITDILKLLATSDTGPVRSAAAVTLTKLNAIDFDADSENGVFVLSSVASLLQEKSSLEEQAKGVEAVSFVISDSQVKMMLIRGDGLKVMQRLIALAEPGAKQSYAYGLAFIFENITMSEDDKRREKLREMEVTEEQWEQFEKLTKSQTKKSGQRDPPEQVALRIETFVKLNGIAALRQLVLSGSGSDRVIEAAARAFCNIATVKEVRSAMITQGALRALFKLTDGGTEKSRQFAAHALGKIFVTTNPHMLKDEQLMDTIGPLVRQVRHNDSDLVVFECCMALTNIATVSWEAKQKMIKSNAIPAFEFAQYSDNLMVRRAATEAINNLIPADEILEWFMRKDKMRLWILFAQAYEEDKPTACAATGALANLTVDERIAKTMADQDEDAIAALGALVASGDLDVMHRAAVCLLNLTETWPEGKGPQRMLEAKVDIALTALLKLAPESPAAGPAKECLRVLLEAKQASS